MPAPKEKQKEEQHAKTKTVKMKGYISKAKDIIYILSFIGALVGWYVSSSSQKAVLEKIVKDNTTQLIEVQKQLKLQYEINGRILMYIELDSNEN